MRHQDTLLCLKLPSVILLLLMPLLTIPDSSPLAFTASIGHPYHGRLANGIPFPGQFRGYQLRDEDRSYTTPEVVGSLLDAIEAVRTQYPDTCDLFIGDFSNAGGGWINHHRSHQNGRDVDLGMYARGNRTFDTFVPMNEENLDVPKTWCFVENLLRSQHVQYIFLDKRIQKLLYDYALSRGADPEYLDTLFGNGRGAVIQHVRSHYDHIHTRFYTPWSTMAARVSDGEADKRAVVELAQQAYLPKRVNYYVKGNERGMESLAKSFGVSTKDLCRWNQMHVNEVLSPGACLVYYKRGFETEPVHLARSLQPNSVAEVPAFRLASLNPARTAYDAPQTSREAPVKDRRSTGSPATYAYTVQRGDTPEKIAKLSGMDVKTLRQLNGMKPTAAMKPGQRIQLVASWPSTKKQDSAASLPTKSKARVTGAKGAATGDSSKKLSDSKANLSRATGKSNATLPVTSRTDTPKNAKPAITAPPKPQDIKKSAAASTKVAELPQASKSAVKKR
jgi:LysM repeat protein